MTDFLEAATRYAAQGWATHPLRNDDNGFPKVAITKEWQKIMPADFIELDWEHATGIGIIGGSNSSNLAFVDIDDNQLAADVLAYLLRSHKCPMMSWTARRRIHIYCIEPEPSPYKKIQFPYKGNLATVELRAQGSYVAAPPSPGYTWMNEDWEPMYGPVSQIWANIVRDAQIVTERAQPAATTATAGYPRPWQKEVGAGERNQAIYVEAHRLREAGIPEDDAIGILRVRFEKSYEQQGIDWRGLEKTIRSAYHKAQEVRASGGSYRTTGIGGVGL